MKFLTVSRCLRVERLGLFLADEPLPRRNVAVRVAVALGRPHHHRVVLRTGSLRRLFPRFLDVQRDRVKTVLTAKTAVWYKQISEKRITNLAAFRDQ